MLFRGPLPKLPFKVLLLVKLTLCKCGNPPQSTEDEPHPKKPKVIQVFVTLYQLFYIRRPPIRSRMMPRPIINYSWSLAQLITCLTSITITHVHLHTRVVPDPDPLYIRVWTSTGQFRNFLFLISLSCLLILTLFNCTPARRSRLTELELPQFSQPPRMCSTTPSMELNCSDWRLQATSTLVS